MVNNGNDQYGSQVSKMYIHTAVCPVKPSRAEPKEVMATYWGCHNSPNPGFGLTFDFKVTTWLDFRF